MRISRSERVETRCCGGAGAVCGGGGEDGRLSAQSGATPGAVV